MLNIGDILENKYRIDQLLSKGGFGRVWKAYDTILEREVAIKELIEVKEEQLDSFVKEMQTLTKLEVLSDERSYNSSEQIIPIGRLDSNLFVLNETNVSRRHCVLTREEDKWLLTDLRSTVGTYVGDKKISNIYLFPGVENITIGTTKCRLILK